MLPVEGGENLTFVGCHFGQANGSANQRSGTACRAPTGPALRNFCLGKWIMTPSSGEPGIPARCEKKDRSEHSIGRGKNNPQSETSHRLTCEQSSIANSK
jgi:hypothetical protein